MQRIKSEYNQLLKASRHSSSWQSRFLMAVIIGFLVLYYVSYVRFHYASAPGADLYNHVLMMQELEQKGFSVFFHDYPRMFHLVLWGVTALTGLDPLRAMLYLIPPLMVGVALANGWLARLIAGPTAGVITTVLLLFFSYQPWQTLYDGGFPNVLAAGVFVPLWIGCVGSFIMTHRRHYLGGAVIFALLIVMTHHISSAYLLFLLVVLLLAYLPRLGMWGGIGLIGVFLLWLSPIAAPVRGLVGQAVYVEGEFPWLHVRGHLDNYYAIWHKASDYPGGIGALVFYAGLMGVAAVMWWGKKERNIVALLTLAWLAALLLGSRIEALSFPVRLARDAGMPLAVAAGVGIFAAWQWASWQARPSVGRVILIGIVLLLGFQQFGRSIKKIAYVYEPTLRYSQADQSAVALVGSTPSIMFDNPLPSVVDPAIYYRPLNEDVARNGGRVPNLGSRTYVLVEISSAHPTIDDRLTTALAEGGYEELTRFQDSLRTVVVFKKA